MIHRANLVVLLALCGGQAMLNANTTYTFGAATNVSLASSSYTSGVWTEVFTGGVGTSEQIDCLPSLANFTNICGNPGPGSAQHITLPAAPGNTAILPGGTTNYLMVDGDNTYGAPVWTSMTGLTVGAHYVVSFYQASSEEIGNNKAYNDSWQVYIIPGATHGTYICPTCATPVNPLPADLAFTSQPMANAGAVSTNWNLQSFVFTATNANEILEFVTNAVATTAGAFQPPMLALTGVSTQVTPEPGTWALTIVGAGALIGVRRFRRKRSAEYKRVLRG